MPKRKGYSPIGIDFQATTAKAVQLHFGSEGASLAACTTLAFDESLMRIADHRPVNIVQKLRAVLRSGKFSGRHAVITLPPNKVDVRTLTLAGPSDDLEKMLSWEAESYLHYKVADATIDYVRLGEARVGKEERSEVLVAAVSTTYASELLNLLAKAGLQVSAVDIVPMALWRLGSYLGGEIEVPVTVIDIGQTTSVAVVLNRGQLRLTRTIPQGGEDLTTRIMDDLEISRPEAELLKKEYGVGVPSHSTQLAPDRELLTKTEIAGTLHEILRPHLEELAKELQKLFRYFSTQSKGMPVGLGYLCGGGGKLKGLGSFLSERTGVRVEKLSALGEAFRPQNGDEGEVIGPEYAVAAGLALREREAD